MLVLFVVLCIRAHTHTQTTLLWPKHPATDADNEDPTSLSALEPRHLNDPQRLPSVVYEAPAFVSQGSDGAGSADLTRGKHLR